MENFVRADRGMVGDLQLLSREEQELMDKLGVGDQAYSSEFRVLFLFRFSVCSIVPV